EVMTPGQAEPLLVLCEPLGGPTERGFPLRLHPYGSPPVQRSLPPPPGSPSLPSLRATRTRPVTLTRHHTRDLLGESSLPGAAPDTPEAIVGRELAGKLVVESVVGVGGMGAVYRARHKQLGTAIAVKVLHERFRSDLEFCARFHAEALVISQLDHPNVVRINDYGQEPDGLLYLAMDFLEGVELQEVLQREGTLPLPRILDIAMQVAAGLGHAHARGIVHRDVKPSNIVLVKSQDDEGRPVDLVKVCDFGIAARTGTSTLLGTPAYMSPEQCAGGEIDGRSDVYALGIILYELATGQLPFSSDDAHKLVMMQRNDAPPAPSTVRNVDARLEQLILRMLQKSPSARPQDMRDLRAELKVIQRPPSLNLHDVGAGRGARGSSPPGADDADEPDDDESLPPVLAPALARKKVGPDIPALAARLAREPVSTLREKLATPAAFLAEAQSLAAAMQLLLEQRELAALAHVVTILRKVAAEPANGASAELAARLVKTLQDPARLAPAAERALAEHEDAAPALLASLGLAAAHALYAARLRVHPTPPARARFVAAMRGIGQASWPLVAAALRRNAPGDASQHDHRLAEDLLRAMPLVADDEAGNIVAKYLRWGDVAVRRAAIPPLVTLWGDRARPLLLGVLLKDPDEGMRVAAIRGLRDLRAIDEHVVRRAEDILGDGEAPQGVRVAVAEALADTVDDARPLAAAVLRRALAPKGGMFAVLRGKTKTVPGPVLLSMSTSLVAIGGADAPKVIEELGHQCDEPLRTQLLGLVGARPRT
ncbi:MAG TPA: serine/threonine-protein kinase, partial [Labilithrix sp.]|nr:serine/threonine-protein kinase [Labilithrix sp.]